jgi:hypothetical protein
MTPTNEPALDYARMLAEARFWGFLTLKYEDGRVVHIRKEENLKPNELPGTKGGNGHERSYR